MAGLELCQVVMSMGYVNGLCQQSQEAQPGLQDPECGAPGSRDPGLSGPRPLGTPASRDPGPVTLGSWRQPARAGHLGPFSRAPEPQSERLRPTAGQHVPRPLPTRRIETETPPPANRKPASLSGAGLHTSADQQAERSSAASPHRPHRPHPHRSPADSARPARDAAPGPEHSGARDGRPCPTPRRWALPDPETVGPARPRDGGPCPTPRRWALPGSRLGSVTVRSRPAGPSGDPGMGGGRALLIGPGECASRGEPEREIVKVGGRSPGRGWGSLRLAAAVQGGGGGR